MRILHIITTVDKAWGGPVEALSQSVRQRVRMGQQIEVATLDAPDAGCLADFPVKAHGLGPARGKYGYTPRLARWISDNRQRFDAAVIHGIWTHASVGGWQGLRRAGIPYVLFTHGMLDPYFRRAKPVKHWVKQVFWLLQGRVLRNAAEVLFTSDEELRGAQGAFFGYSWRSRAVAYGTAGAPPATSDATDAFRHLLPGLGDRPYLLYLSRIHPKKGCDLLIRGFAACAADRPDLQLVMAGPAETPLADELRALAETLGVAERIHWAGMVKGPTKAGALHGAEAFVLTSHQENFGIAVAEALSFGKPVLISDKINIWREIEAAGAGIVRPDDVDGATDLLRVWNALPAGDRKVMSDAAIACHARHFSAEAAARDLTAALNRAIASENRR